MIHADYVLRLQEDLSHEEMPPEWMWPLSWEMERWLDRVIRDRKARYGGDSDDDEDTDDWEGNELAAEWKRKAAV